MNVEAARFFARDKKRERRSERAHCGYGVFIHWYQVTRFRPLDRSRKRPTRLSLPIKMPRPFSLSTSLYLSLSSFSLGTASKAPWGGRTARKKKKKRENKESTGLPVRRHWMSGYTYRTYAYPAASLLYVEDLLRSPFCPISKPIALRFLQEVAECWTADKLDKLHF